MPKRHHQQIVSVPDKRARANDVLVQKQFSLPGPWGQAIILAIIIFIFYFNTFSNEAAFDDRMAVTDNEYVQQGFAGIGSILTTDAYQSYLEHRNAGNQLAGGRYRPLSLITFAIEQQVMGTAPDNETADMKEVRVAHEMHERHVVNVLLYIIAVIALLYLFRNVVFASNPVAAFIAAMLFAVHPIHTEVVANVKSRDEILSLLFITLTFILSFRYRETKQKGSLAWACISFFLALLSKEYAITVVVLLPVGIYLFGKETPGKSTRFIIPFLIPLAAYLALRFSAVTAAAEGAGNDVLNNPYLYASGAEKIATKLVVLLDYLRLLVFPHPLAADYSYNAIPYKEFANPLVWLSLLLHGAMIAILAVFLKKRHLLAFAIAFYLVNLLLVSNFLFDVGAPMGERLIYHSSAGFCIAIAYLLVYGFEKTGSPKAAQPALAALVIIIVVLSGFKTIARNSDWKNDATLFLADVQTVPNSALANNNAAATCMSFAKATMEVTERREWLGKAIGYFDKAITVYPGYMSAYLNRGLCYFNKGDPERALPDWDTVRKHAPGLQNLSKYLSIAGNYFYTRGMKYNEAHKVDSAVIALNQSVEAMPTAAEVWYQLGNAYYQMSNFASAKQAVAKALQLAPDHPAARKLGEEMNGK
jgi:protein O-mannosyl-transferase